ncbi:MAG: RNA-guided endonuclease TnpB family protein [Salinibacter sp.]
MPDPEPEPTVTDESGNKKSVGIDLGVADIVVTSDGWKSGNPKYLEDDLYRLQKAQRRLSRKEKNGPNGPSENWKKQKRRVANIHAEIKDKREDSLHQLSRKIVDENQVIALESLNVKGMQQNRSLARPISDTGWSTLVRMIEYKVKEAGRTVIKIDRWFPSTKRCCECGYVTESKSLSVRSWDCPRCGAPTTETSTPPKTFVPLGWREPPKRRMTLEDTVRRGTPPGSFDPGQTRMGL